MTCPHEMTPWGELVVRSPLTSDDAAAIIREAHTRVLAQTGTNVFTFGALDDVFEALCQEEHQACVRCVIRALKVTCPDCGTQDPYQCWRVVYAAYEQVLDLEDVNEVEENTHDGPVNSI